MTRRSVIQFRFYLNKLPDVVAEIEILWKSLQPFNALISTSAENGFYDNKIFFEHELSSNEFRGCKTYFISPDQQFLPQLSANQLSSEQGNIKILSPHHYP